MDIFIKWHHGIKFYVLQVIDLGSRIKLEPMIKEGDFTGEEVAEHINLLMLWSWTCFAVWINPDNGKVIKAESLK